jgi:hypothetical protein
VSRVAPGALARPITRRQGIGFTLFSGVTVQAGPDYDRAVLAYRYMWGGN